MADGSCTTKKPVPLWGWLVKAASLELCTTCWQPNGSKGLRAALMFSGSSLCSQMLHSSPGEWMAANLTSPHSLLDGMFQVKDYCRTRVCMHAHAHTHTCLHAHICADARTQAHMHAHTHNSNGMYPALTHFLSPLLLTSCHFPPAPLQ